MPDFDSNKIFVDRISAELRERLDRQEVAALSLTPPASPQSARASIRGGDGGAESSVAAKTADELQARVDDVCGRLASLGRAAAQVQEQIARFVAQRDALFEQQIAARQANNMAEVARLKQSEKNLIAMLKEKQEELLAVERQRDEWRREEAQLRQRMQLAENTRLKEQLLQAGMLRKMDEESRQKLVDEHRDEVAKVQREADERVRAERLKTEELDKQLAATKKDSLAQAETIKSTQNALQEQQASCAALGEQVKALEETLAKYTQLDECDWQFRRVQRSKVTSMSITAQVMKVVVAQRGDEGKK